MSRPLSSAEKIRMVTMAEAGCGSGRIAVALGRHKSTIYYHMLELGFAKPKRVKPRPDYQRNGRPVYAWQRVEDEALEALSTAGLRLTAIVAELSRRFPSRPRKPHSVRARLTQLALMAESEEVSNGV